MDLTRWQHSKCQPYQAEFPGIKQVIFRKGKDNIDMPAHYFRDRTETEDTVKNKKQGFSEYTTELYNSIKGLAGYAIGYLQEFSHKQIEEYLEKSLPDTWKDACDTINKVYNLKNLSSRPVLIDMIVKSFPTIRERSGETGEIKAADLYTAYVEMWQERDDWRMALTREGRGILVEELAERLWESDTKKIHYSLLNDIITDHLKDKSSALLDIELASSEVRTASFLIRDANGNYTELQNKCPIIMKNNSRFFNWIRYDEQVEKIYPNTNNATIEKIFTAMNASPTKKGFIRIHAIYFLLQGESKEKVAKNSNITIRHLKKIQQQRD